MTAFATCFRFVFCLCFGSPFTFIFHFILLIFNPSWLSGLLVYFQQHPLCSLLLKLCFYDHVVFLSANLVLFKKYCFTVFSLSSSFNFFS